MMMKKKINSILFIISRFPSDFLSLCLTLSLIFLSVYLRICMYLSLSIFGFTLHPFGFEFYVYFSFLLCIKNKCTFSLVFFFNRKIHFNLIEQSIKVMLFHLFISFKFKSKFIYTKQTEFL